MKNLLLITSHHQREEFFIAAKLIQKTKILKDFDLIFHNNNQSIDKNYLKLCFDQFPNVNKRLIHTDKNAGYALGLHQSLSDLYDTLKEYDNVIHFHCDVFIIDENKLIDVMNSNQEYPFIFSKCNEPDPINCAISPDHRMISTDIFIIHPKVLKMNVFSNYIEYMNKKIWCEIFLQTELEKNKIPYAIVKRYDNESWFPRRPCMWGGWHEHDFSQIIQMI